MRTFLEVPSLLMRLDYCVYPACTRVSQETLLVDGQCRYLLGIVSNREFDLSRSYALYEAALVEVVLSIMKECFRC